MKRLIKLGSRGDTIIEVLLAIAVMSMVLSVSYGLANRSSQSNRQAQERAEAQKIGEEQLELLRGYINEDTQWNNATDVCFMADNTATVEDETGQITDQTSDCQGRGPGGRYNIKITVKEPDAGNPDAGYVYTVDTNWDNTKGGTDQLALSYKLASTGDIPRTPHFACSDGVNNNDNDTLIDFPADPDCTSATGNSEDPPPVVQDLCLGGIGVSGIQNPVPSSHYAIGDNCYPHFDFTIAPRSFYSCIAWESRFNDGKDACDNTSVVPSPSLLAWRAFGAYYNFPGMPTPSAPYDFNIEIKYRQYSSSAAPVGYGFNLWVFGYDSAWTTNFFETLILPAGSPGEQRTFTKNITGAWGGSAQSMNQLAIFWNNNVGADPNLQIDSVRFYR